jgi:catechol 2,3-dioxygenase
MDAGIAIDGASDHGVSEAVYMRDPDDNGVELYHDRPGAAWDTGPQGDGRLDVAGLLDELDA